MTVSAFCSAYKKTSKSNSSIKKNKQTKNLYKSLLCVSLLNGDTVEIYCVGESHTTFLMSVGFNLSLT